MSAGSGFRPSDSQVWLALTFQLSSEFVEQISDALLELGALSVELTDAHAGCALEVPLFAEPPWNSDAHWSLAQVRVLLEHDSNGAQVLRSACQAVGLDPIPEHASEKIPDRDWVRATQAQFAPVRVSERLWIVPSWHEPPCAQAINLRLDPGLAFGTGSHPTTWQCLRWLDANMRGGESVLDYGCGSGILAIAAAKLGATQTLGTDIDPQALVTAHDNAVSNGVEIAWVPPEDLPAHATYDIVLANILANPLRALAPLLSSRVRSGGYLVLAGILDRQAVEVVDSYAPWVELAAFEPHAGWTSLVGQRTRVDEH